MSDENTQPTPEPLQPEPISTPPVENPISEPNPVPVSPDEPTTEAPVSPLESAPVEMPPDAPQASPNPESAILDKDQNSANEPFDSAQGKPLESIPNEPNNQNVTVEKHGNDITITEVMQPKSEPENGTAQMAGNEPFDTPRQSSEQATREKPLNLAEEIKIKKREETLKLANQTRQEKKRKKIDEILDLFAKQTNLTNDEVEKLLHVSDATATRYLETLEKEGKIKQVGKTGTGVKYEKI